jgi:hypothetical protein
VIEENCIHEMAPGTCSICKPKPKRVARPRRPTTTPHSGDDPIASLSGSKDVSMPVHALGPYLGDRTDWMPAMNGYPHDLRAGGWLYLRCDERLAARARVSAMAWRAERPWRTGDNPNNEGWGPGLVFAVDQATWEPFDQHLGEDAERMRQGYRYHLTDRSGVVHHLMAGDPIPDGDWDLDG